MANESRTFFLPDSGLPAVNRVDYPISAPIVISSFAARISTPVAAGGVVTFRLLRNNVPVAVISFIMGEGLTPKVINLAVPVSFDPGDLLTMEVEVLNFQATFIASATLGLV